MSIDDGFRKMLAGVKQADAGRDEIMAGLEAAWAGRRDLDGQLTELRDTVTTLQAMILDQGRQLQEQGRTLVALREQLRGDGGQP